MLYSVSTAAEHEPAMTAAPVILDSPNNFVSQAVGVSEVYLDMSEELSDQFRANTIDEEEKALLVTEAPLPSEKYRDMILRKRVASYGSKNMYWPAIALGILMLLALSR